MVPSKAQAASDRVLQRTTGCAATLESAGRPAGRPAVALRNGLGVIGHGELTSRPGPGANEQQIAAGVLPEP